MANEVEKSKLVQEDEISLKELILKIREWWQYLWSKKWIIIAAGLIGGLLGLGYAVIKKPIYTATTTFVLESGEKSGGLGSLAGLASMAGVDLGGGGGGIFQGENIIELYKSRTMLEKTLLSGVDSISQQPLIERYLEFSGMRKNWKDKPELQSLQFTVGEVLSHMKEAQHRRLKDSIVSKIVEDLNKTSLAITKPDKKLSIIKVNVNSKDEIFAKRFNEELVDNVNEFYIQTKTKKSLDNVNILQHKTDSVRAVMNGAIYSAVAVADATPNANPTRQVQRVAPIQRAQFSAETNKAILGEMVKNLEMSKMALLKETPLIQVVDEPVYPLDKHNLGKINAFIIGSFILAILAIIVVVIKKVLFSIINL
ncbi:Wzz/FepE/Etk N-terminal domain-containing protein [Pedobacter chitinilyticus]|uniref:Lipopolysaccharide biosynthesis protein n=1 Tax=Pedobacter chitinilyticus TaxID=2233776 RepID=A0A443YNY8_9SPHI|nr:Wzz/FepE/Etk N-terminal domain-containing protein [Pedobacter chitinilyticus]RWU05456.1 lipopolysaccharide biosynthesis protein [Pedobacter chitinilyticus]